MPRYQNLMRALSASRPKSIRIAQQERRPSADATLVEPIDDETKPDPAEHCSHCCRSNCVGSTAFAEPRAQQCNEMN
jgi:hypothetical protein